MRPKLPAVVTIPAAEMMHPDAVRHHAGRERILFRSNPFRQRQPPSAGNALVLRRGGNELLPAGQGGDIAGRHGVAFIAVVGVGQEICRGRLVRLGGNPTAAQLAEIFAVALARLDLVAQAVGSKTVVSIAGCPMARGSGFGRSFSIAAISALSDWICAASASAKTSATPLTPIDSTCAGQQLLAFRAPLLGSSHRFLYLGRKFEQSLRPKLLPVGLLDRGDALLQRLRTGLRTAFTPPRAA